MRYFISAGEASGDLHAGRLIEALRQRDPQAEITFLGGDEMAAAAGSAPLIHYRDMAFMGYTQVITHLGQIMRNLRTAKEAISREKPDALILVDYPGFNLKLAKYASGLGIPVYYYIAPKVWAWKEWRVKQLRKYCTKILSILPFEEEWFRSRGVEVEYVGNPSVEEVDRKVAQLGTRDEFIGQWRLNATKPILAIVPGSRQSEIRNNLPLMEAAAEQFPDFQPVVAGAPGITRKFYRDLTTLPIVDCATFELVHHASLAIVTSGTATLETALLGTPQVICYRGNGTRLTYEIMKRVLTIPFVSLPNLIAGEEVAKELLQHLCTPQAIAAELQRLLPGQPGHDEQLRAYARMRTLLGSRIAPQAAADAICR